MSQNPAPTGVQMRAVSAPQFKTELTHGPSSSKVQTEAPKDNGGTGMSFSPTDLVGAALLSCAITTMHLVATRERIPLGEVKGRVEKRMTPPPRKIAQLVLELEMPSGLSPDQRHTLEETARGCPVARSLHPDVQLPMTFRYP